MEGFLYTDIKGVGYLQVIPEHLLEVICKHGPIGLRQVIDKGYEPSKELINQVLSCERWIQAYPSGYNKLLGSIYGNNSIMFRKWERYAEGVRSL
jgi:hypothetical protein